MIKQLRTKLIVALSALFAVFAVMSVIFAVTAKADENSSPSGDGVNVVYSESFDSIPEGFDNLELFGDYGAVITNGSFTLPIDEASLPASNNYEIEFDLFLKSSGNLNVALKGLAVDRASGNPCDVFLRVEADGMYWILNANNTNHQIYNNSGDDHGALDATPVALLDGAAHVKIVHFEGYVELWVNGTRRIVTNLNGFGNNSYNTRGFYDEGKITGIEFAPVSNNTVCLDNIVVSEAVGKATEYTASNTSGELGAYTKVFPLSAQNLYRENYVIETTYKVEDATKADYYPTLRLFGINNSLSESYGFGENAYFINVQSHVSGNNFNAGIYYHTPEHLSGDWAGVGGSEVVPAAEDGTMVYRLEVYGDMLDFYLNGTLVISKTFTELGFPKGAMQYIAIRDTNAATGTRWTNFSYAGYEEQTAATIKADKDRVLTGETLTVTAEIFGLKEGHEFFWYVDGEKQTEEGLVLTLENLPDGEHTIVYKSETIESNAVVVQSVNRRINISSESEGKKVYPTDEIIVDAVLEGDFTGETVKWYVNGEAREETDEKLTLSNLAAGEYTICYKTETVSSNEIVITVSEGFVTAVTEKGSYFNTESAVFNAELTGIREDAEIKWFVDGAEVAEATGKTFTLSLADAEIGKQIMVKCTADGAESAEVIISVVYDVQDKITGDENYKVLPQVEIKTDGSYGDYAVGTDEDGAYLYCDKAGGPYWSYPGEMPTGTAFIFSYKLYVPEDINGKYFVYPCLTGMNSKYPNMSMETAVEVNSNGLRPYIKDQGTNVSYDVGEYGFGKNLAYGEGIVDKGWIDIAVAVDGMYISMYINGEIVLFFRLATATVASGVGFNMWPDAGDTIPVRMKDIKFSYIAQPAPDLTDVTITVSETETAVGGSVTLTARPNPFNAEVDTILWYVNGTAVEANGLTYTFNAEEAGDYTIYCVINGIKSNERTVTVTAPAEEKGGNQTLLWSLVGVGIGLVVIGAGLTVFFVIRKKKKNK